MSQHFSEAKRTTVGGAMSPRPFGNPFQWTGGEADVARFLIDGAIGSHQGRCGPPLAERCSSLALQRTLPGFPSRNLSYSNTLDSACTLPHAEHTSRSRISNNPRTTNTHSSGKRKAGWRHHFLGISPWKWCNVTSNLWEIQL
jgi:hypothetical protein